MHKAATEEFTEDNRSTLLEFLSDCFTRANKPPMCILCKRREGYSDYATNIIVCPTCRNEHAKQNT